MNYQAAKEASTVQKLKTMGVDPGALKSVLQIKGAGRGAALAALLRETQTALVVDKKARAAKAAYVTPEAEAPGLEPVTHEVIEPEPEVVEIQEAEAPKEKSKRGRKKKGE